MPQYVALTETHFTTAELGRTLKLGLRSLLALLVRLAHDFADVGLDDLAVRVAG